MKTYSNYNSMKSIARLITLALILCLAVGTAWGDTTYRLSEVNSVTAGNKYVFVRNNRALKGVVNSSSQVTTETYSSSSLSGNESYVWILETATNGFYIKNCSLATNQYLKYAGSKTDMVMGNASTIWTFEFNNGVASLIISASNRFLGETGDNTALYKAYATSNINNYGHDFTVYELVEEGECESDPTIGNPTFTSIDEGSITVSCPSISAGTYCSIEDYGFVWKASSDPTIDDNKTQKGTNNQSSAYSQTLSIDFTTGVTYYFKAYATNGNSTSLSVTALQVTPQSVEFNSNGGSEVATIYVNKGLVASEPTSPTKTGYQFANWCTTSELNVNVDWSSAISANKLYYAKWTPNSYSVVFNKNGGQGDAMPNQAFTYDADQNLSTNTYEPAAGSHKYFAGWATTPQKANAGTFDYADGQRVNNLTTDNNGTVTLYAVWKDHTYTNYRTTCCTKYAITKVEAAGGTLDIEGDKAEACADESIALTATPDENHVGGTIKVIKTGSNPEEDVTETYYNAGTGKLTMPAFGVTISATFAEPSSPLLVVSGEALDENTLAFGDQGKDQTSAGRSFTITGSNLAADVTWALSGDDASMFAVTTASPLSQSAVSAGQEITVTFTPTGIGEKSATLTFSSTGAQNKAIALTGTGKWVVSWVANDGEPAFATTLCADGETPTLPDGTPTSCDGTSTAFAGWTQTKWIGKLTQDEVDAKADAEKVYTSAVGMPAVTANTTYHAVFAVRTQTGVEAVKAQTLQYDTWTYSGSTTNKSNNSYRLFHENSYIESAAFDLSTLNKVIVYGGTFGGDANNSLTIGDGTNTWKDVEVSGNSETGTNTFIDGTALSGIGKLYIKSNSGSNSGNGSGVRISKVEIYVSSPVYSYSDYMTTCRDDVHAITIADGIAGGVVNAAKWGLEDESVTLTATPNDGYNFGSWNATKTGDAGTVVPVENNAFNMPAYDVTVSATFAPKPMTTLTLSESALLGEVGNGATLTVSSYEPADLLESQKTITWTSDNASVASVENGVVSYKAPGTATITAAWTQDADVKATCAVTVYQWNLAGADTYEVTDAPVKSYTDIAHFDKSAVTIKANYVRSDDPAETKQVEVATENWTAKLNGTEIADDYAFLIGDNGKTLALYVGETLVWSEAITVVEETKDRFVDNLWSNTTIVKTGENYTLPTLTERPGDAGTCSDHTTFAGWVEASKADNPTAGDIETGNHTAANKTFYAVWSKSENVNKEFTVSKNSFANSETGSSKVTFGTDISYTTQKNDGTTSPAINSTGALRLYQAGSGKTYGGSITIAAASEMTLKKVDLTTTGGDEYKYIEAQYTTTGLSAEQHVLDGHIVLDGLTNRYLTIINTSTSSDDRIDISKIEVTYEKEVTEVDYITDCEPRYDVEFLAGTGAIGSYDKVTKKAGVEINLPDGSALSKDHHTFDKWYSVSYGTYFDGGASYTVPVDGDILEAQWTEDNHAFVTFKNGEDIIGEPLKVYDGGTYDLLGTQTADGKEFIGWTWDGNKYKAGQASQHMSDPAIDRTYTAVWMPVIDVTTIADADLADGKWILVENKSQLKAGDFIVIAAAGYNVAMSNYQKTSNRDEAAVTKIADTLTYTSNVAPLFLQYDPENDYYAFYDRAYDTDNDGIADGSGYLYSDNNLKTQASVNGFQGVWSINITDKKASIVAQGNNNERIMRYNAGASGHLFNCYGSETQQALSIYKWHRVLKSGDTNLSDVTLTDAVIVKNGATLTVDAASSLVDLTVEAGGKVETTKELTVINNLTINSEAGKSGQVSNAGNVHANNVYMDVTFYKSAATLDATTANQWYMISAPFDVNLNGGFLQTDGTPMVFGTDFDLFEYDGAKRANTGVTGWKRVSGQMKAGTACLIGFNEGQATTIRLKAANTAIGEATSITLTAYDGDADNQNWNGVANPNLHYISLNKDVQYYDNVARGYNPGSKTETSYVVGTAFFIQESGVATISNTVNATLQAPRRATQSQELEFCVRLAKEDANWANHIYIRASEDASAQYEQGHDMVTWNGTTAKTALLWTENYGTRLAIEEAPLLNNQASYALGLYVPANGTYRIEVANTQTDATLYLTQGGTIIWNLTDGAYEVDLTAGTTSEYGLLLQAGAPQIPTGVEEVGASKAAQKVVIDDHVYILRGEKMYDTTGKVVK